ncbi:MAG: hypothetical protein IPJ39_19410 [Saprospiraceae bacterium]|nr:hypothetical protein [Saprospiraceae bacterium]
MFDVRKGGQIYSTTKFYTEFNGTAVTTLIGDRKPFIIPNSVVAVTDANGVVTYAPNTIPTIANAYLDDGNSGRNVLDGGFVKLRDVGLT